MSLEKNQKKKSSGMSAPAKTAEKEMLFKAQVGSEGRTVKIECFRQNQKTRLKMQEHTKSPDGKETKSVIFVEGEMIGAFSRAVHTAAVSAECCGL